MVSIDDFINFQSLAKFSKTLFSVKHLPIGRSERGLWGVVEAGRRDRSTILGARDKRLSITIIIQSCMHVYIYIYIYIYIHTCSIVMYMHMCSCVTKVNSYLMHAFLFH